MGKLFRLAHDGDIFLPGLVCGVADLFILLGFLAHPIFFLVAGVIIFLATAKFMIAAPILPLIWLLAPLVGLLVWAVFITDMARLMFSKSKRI
jgi:hypothetical protein